MELTEILGGTLNIAILSIFYTVFGACISYLMFHLFDDFDKEWQSAGLVYQTADISLELSLVGTIAFWTMFLIREYPPIFSVHKQLDKDVDTYISGVFFAFAMFLFLGDLTTKIQFLYNTYLKQKITKAIPEDWSLTKMIKPRKTEKQKTN